MSSHGIPVISVPGNHELNIVQGDDLYSSCIGDHDWEFAYGDSLFIGTKNVQLPSMYSSPFDDTKNFFHLRITNQ